MALGLNEAKKVITTLHDLNFWHLAIALGAKLDAVISNTRALNHSHADHNERSEWRSTRYQWYELRDRILQDMRSVAALAALLEMRMRIQAFYPELYQAAREVRVTYAHWSGEDGAYHKPDMEKQELLWLQRLRQRILPCQEKYRQEIAEIGRGGSTSGSDNISTRRQEAHNRVRWERNGDRHT
ncbi:MAG: hypothetical protein M1835_004830 [Candelina submexicana]|nr:MAG: hypothetical protein M1835_004830 [Candelina submexicana]